MGRHQPALWLQRRCWVQLCREYFFPLAHSSSSPPFHSQLANNGNVDELGGGFNGAIPGQADGAFGSGYTVNSTMVVLGLGGSLGNRSIDVEVVQDKVTGMVRVVVNGKEVEL